MKGGGRFHVRGLPNVRLEVTDCARPDGVMAGSQSGKITVLLLFSCNASRLSCFGHPMNFVQR